jgi:hypothetical protein
MTKRFESLSVTVHGETWGLLYFRIPILQRKASVWVDKPLLHFTFIVLLIAYTVNFICS